MFLVLNITILGTLRNVPNIYEYFHCCFLGFLGQCLTGHIEVMEGTTATFVSCFAASPF
jgi:hypothetical protein